MKVAQDPVTLLKLMEQHELAIGRLYKVFADRFVELADFWSDLSKQEFQHASWVKSLASWLDRNPDDIIVQRFPTAAIETSLRFIYELIDRAAGPEFELINAISHALHLEEALIENKYFEIVQTDNPQAKLILSNLAADTNQHFQKIRNLWLKYK